MSKQWRENCVTPTNRSGNQTTIRRLHSFLAGNYRSHFCISDWNVGVANQPISAFLNPEAEIEVDWFPTIAKSKRYLADPFAIQRNGKVHILCEEYDRQLHKGKIVSIEFTGGKFSSRPQAALELPFHISYPYLIQYKGEVYCIPETYRAREIALYRAKDFPHNWAKEVTLIRDVAAVDTTVFQYEGNWWLTCSDDEKGRYDRLYAWYAGDLMGPWEPHPTNPVKTDIRSSRPAGTPFIHNGRLYRPAQDCSRTYGGRVILNEVQELSPTRFREKPVSVVEPFTQSRYTTGVHTLSAVGNLTLIDGQRTYFDMKAFLGSLRQDTTNLARYVSSKV